MTECSWRLWPTRAFMKETASSSYIYGVKKAGRGDILLKLEELKSKLDAQGLFDEKLKRPLPYFASRIGVVTSRTGAVIKDIITVSRRRFNNISILLAPVLVQGEDAPESIVRGLKYISDQDVDVIIVGRGGGSVEDLWAFNDEKGSACGQGLSGAGYFSGRA